MDTEQGMTEQGTAVQRTERRSTAEAASVQAFDVVHAVLSEEPISVDVAIAAVESETAGAVVIFSGVAVSYTL
jgi:hypothetical protein